MFVGEFAVVKEVVGGSGAEGGGLKESIAGFRSRGLGISDDRSAPPGMAGFQGL
jgi:hypothetical protein